MQLGKFSISLSVKNLGVSKVFYETLGFRVDGGDESQDWLIMQNGEANIGLFQGMFEKNMLTFCPGWDNNRNTLETFTDIRQIQEKLKEAGITFEQEAEAGNGSASFTVIDPDGTPILLDQYVANPN